MNQDATSQPQHSEDLDPVSVEVIGNAFMSIVEEMGETLVKSSYSTNIKERRDCSTALFDVEGQTIAQAEHIPLHLGSLIGFSRTVAERFGPDEIRPGDVWICNDAYTGGGTHLPDVVIASPIFFQEEHVGWATNLAHHADFVDRGNAHIYQEGTRIPPIRLYRGGEVQEDVLALLLLNWQVPDERQKDLHAQISANRLGAKRFQELCAVHGVGTVKRAAAALMDYAERRMRAGIATIPDGRYAFSDVFDNEQLPQDLTLNLTITVSGDELVLDFTDNPPQVRADLNMVITALQATCYYAVKSVVDPGIPPNAGLYRPILIEATPGTIVCAAPPGGVNGRAQTCQRVADLILGALHQAVPERVTAAHNGANTSITFSGVDPRTGQFYTYLETIGGGFGARIDMDGIDGVQVHVTNTSNLPIEALEAEHPLTVQCYELVDDSGGTGRQRGGMGIRREIRVDGHEARIRMRGSRMNSAPWGLDGGGEGGTYRLEFSPGAEPFVNGFGALRDGDVISIVTAGGGGYGVPAERDPDALAADLADGKVSERAAEVDYGSASGSTASEAG